MLSFRLGAHSKATQPLSRCAGYALEVARPSQVSEDESHRQLEQS
jgi:hypothetical protein